MQRERKLTGINTITKWASCPFQTKYCIDAEWLDSTIDLGVIDDVSHFNELPDDQRKTFLKSKRQEDKNDVISEALEDCAENHLLICMYESNARSGIRTFFTSYVSNIRQNG